MTLDHLVSIVLLVRFDLVDAMAAHMIEIVLDQFEAVLALLPLARISAAFGVANQIAPSRVVHACGQRVLFQQQLFAQRLQIRHVNMNERMSPQNGQLIRFVHTKVPFAFVRMPIVGHHFNAVQMQFHVCLQLGVAIDQLIALLPFACEIYFAFFRIRWQWMLRTKGQN